MKAEKITDNAEVHELISRAVLSLQDSGVDIIDPDFVANVVESKIDVHRMAPHLSRYLAVEQLKANTRKYLAHMFNPVIRAQQLVESGTDDLFDDLLQDHYPVKREILGEVKSVYAKKEVMSEDEIIIVASKMEKAGNTLIEHAKALLAWFQSK